MFFAQSVQDKDVTLLFKLDNGLMFVFFKNITTKGLFPWIIRIAPIIIVEEDAPFVVIKKEVHCSLIIGRNGCLSSVFAPQEKHIGIVGQDHGVFRQEFCHLLGVSMIRPCLACLLPDSPNVGQETTK